MSMPCTSVKASPSLQGNVVETARGQSVCRAVISGTHEPSVTPSVRATTAHWVRDSAPAGDICQHQAAILLPMRRHGPGGRPALLMYVVCTIHVVYYVKGREGWLTWYLPAWLPAACKVVCHKRCSEHVPKNCGMSRGLALTLAAMANGVRCKPSSLSEPNGRFCMSDTHQGYR